MSPLFATRRRAEEFDAVVARATTPRHQGGGVGRPVRRPARARRRPACGAPAAGAPRVRRGATGEPGGRGRDDARSRPGRRGPAPAAHARPRPGPQPAGASRPRRRRRPGPRRRHGDALGGGPVGAARRPALPAQARHRVGRGRHPRQRAGQGHHAARERHDPPRRGLAPRRRGPPGRDRGHPRRLHRAGHRGLRPAALVVRREGRRRHGRRPALVHRGVDDVAVGPRRPASRERPGRVGARGHHADAHRRRGAAGLPDLRRYGSRRDRADAAHRGHRLRHGRAARRQPAGHRPAHARAALAGPATCPRAASPSPARPPAPVAGRPPASPRATRPRCRPAYRRPASRRAPSRPWSGPPPRRPPAPWCSRAST